jgi:dsRNA-specific ribonuclease
VTVSVEVEGISILGIGDASSRKDAEKLAALSAVIQLNDNDLVGNTHIFLEATAQIPC